MAGAAVGQSPSEGAPAGGPIDGGAGAVACGGKEEASVGSAVAATTPAAAVAGLPAQIVQLEETVVNRIAAGEVVVRPANALKEMMENSIDAGSQHIVVALKAGGLKMLRIEDDGHGIRRDDMAILCERFTTSKLRKYEDLSSIGTFGFRGEALASISHVAHVTVTTMTAQDSTAHMAQYTDGLLRAPPRICAGTRGTTIVVEELFYNNSTRRQALGKDTIEHAKVLDVIQKYAIHYPKVSFTCRKATGAVAELHTQGGAESTSRQVVAAVQGSNLAAQLFDFEVSSEEPKFSCRGLATGPQWSARTMSMSLFINNRLVECAGLKRCVETAYHPVMPRHQHPWIYLSVELDPTTVDVNVHPTKSSVQFLYEEAIAQKIQNVLAEKLTERAGTRTFDSQTSLLACVTASNGRQQQTASRAAVAGGRPGTAAAAAGPALTPAPAPLSMDAWSSLAAGQPPASLGVEAAADATGRTAVVITPPPQQKQGPKRVELNPLRVRTDHRQRSLQSLWVGQNSQAAGEADSAANALVPLEAPPGGADDAAGLEVVQQQSPGGTVVVADAGVTAAVPPPPSSALVAAAPDGGDDADASRKEAFREAQQLTSVCELKASVALACCDKDFAQSLNQSVYVGPIDRELALLQCGSSLCMVNLAILGREFAYQRMLRLFGGVGQIALREPLPLVDLLSLGILDPGSGYEPDKFPHVDVEGLASQLEEVLVGKAELLDEYLMLEIRDGCLWSVPNALGLTSEAGLKFDDLPLFLVRLCTDTNWEDEKACFESMCRTVADFAVEVLQPDAEEVRRVEAATVGPATTGRAADFEALNSSVASGEFPDIVAAAAAASAKRQRTHGPQALQEMRFLHEAIRADAASAGPAAACKWPSAFRKDGTVVKLVALEQLYRIFERC